MYSHLKMTVPSKSSGGIQSMVTEDFLELDVCVAAV